MTKKVITNPNVGMSMSDLEARARAGCPIARHQLQRQCMGFASSVMDDMREGADMVDRKELLIFNK